MGSFCVGAGNKYFIDWAISITLAFSNTLLFNNQRITNVTHKHTKTILSIFLILIENCDFSSSNLQPFHDQRKPDHISPLMDNL